MTFRGKIFLYGGILLLFVIGLILALIFRPPQTQTPTNTVVNAPTNTQSVGTNIPVPQIVQPKPVTKEQVTAANKEVLIQTRVKNFVEVFGSYGVEANFKNFAEIKPYVTDQVAKWLDSYPAQLKTQQGADFIGVSTRVLSQKFTSLTDSAATVTASTQREETRTSGTQVIYRDMIVNLKLVGGEWLVDGAYWQ